MPLRILNSLNLMTVKDFVPRNVGMHTHTHIHKHNFTNSLVQFQRIGETPLKPRVRNTESNILVRRKGYHPRSWPLVFCSNVISSKSAD